MQVVVITNESLKEELLGSGCNAGVIWIENIADLQNYKNPDAVIDLLFENNKDRIDVLKKFHFVIINSVEHTLLETDNSFVRINAWDGFLKSMIIEASCLNEALKQKAEDVFEQFDKKIEWLEDVPGFIAPRVISMIINEAFLSLEEGVSTKEEIDTAMKLGTNYPYGPFEWAEKIGTHKISSLLNKLALKNTRYAPAPLLQQSLKSR